jgi:hypothetical protein
MVCGLKAKPVHPSPPKGWKGSYIRTPSRAYACMPVCLPKALFKRSTKNLRQATARHSNGGPLYKFQMMRISARTPRLNLWHGGYSCKVAPSA